MKPMMSLAVASAALIALATPAAAQVRSVSKIEFGPPGILFVADWRASSVHAISLPTAADATPKPFNLMDLQNGIEHTLGTRDFAVRDLRVRPGTSEVYLAVSYGKEQAPAVLRVDGAGAISRVDLAKESGGPVMLREAPSGDLTFWDKTPERSLTVSAMRWHEGKLYLAGLSNQTFASTLRVVGYPFDGRQAMMSIAMFHTSHDQTETRAPIRTFDFVEVNGVDTLVAAYMCTPLVAIPVSDLKDGAHVTGKTIGELGYGNTPVNMLIYSAPDDTGKAADWVMVTNVNRNAESIPMTSLVSAVSRPGMTTAVPWSQIAGVDVVQTPISGAIGIDNLGDQFFVYVRRSLDNGDLQLVTAQKAVKLRISDFISEYDFPDFRYPAGQKAAYIKNLQDGMARQEGFTTSTTGTTSR